MAYQAGYASTAITPPLGVPLAGYTTNEGRTGTASGVLEDLRASCVALACGGEVAIFLTADAMALSEAVAGAVYDRAASHGVDPGAVHACATHTHNAPDLACGDPWFLAGRPEPRVAEFLGWQLAGLVTAALADLAPADLAAGRAECGINVNRRQKLADGGFARLPWLGKDPSGPADREVTVLVITRPGRDRQVLAWYGCHPVVLGMSTRVSPDFPGAARRFAEAALQGAAVLYFQGASGDVNPVVNPGTPADCERLGRQLGAAIVQAVEQAQPVGEPRLAWHATDVPLPVRSTWTEPGDATTGDWAAVAQEQYAGQQAIPVTVRTLALGRFAVTGAPVELFASLGTSVKDQSPFRLTAFTGLDGPRIGYLPTSTAFSEGGYEAESSPFAPGGGEQLARTAVEALHALCR